MNNTDKLLRAFIDASGYEIEEVKTDVELYAKAEFHADGLKKLASGSHIRTEQVIDYKVTKKSGTPQRKSAEERLNEATARAGQQ